MIQRYGTLTPTCSVVDCEKAPRTRGLCPKHYWRLRQYGDPLREPQRPNYGSGRYLNYHGYVILRRHSHPLADSKGRVLEHRMVWFDAHGPIPPGFDIHHLNRIRDDNRLENLEAISRREHHRAHATRLSDAVVRRIRERAALGETYLDLAVDYGVTVDHVGRIVRRALRNEDRVP